METQSLPLKTKLRAFLEDKAKIESQSEREEILIELTQSSQSRYHNGQVSNQRSNQYLEWFTSSRLVKYDRNALLNHKKFLELKSKASEVKAYEASEAEKKVKQVIGDTNSNTFVKEKAFVHFFQAIYGQLTINKQILQKEIELANEFSMYAQNFIRAQFANIKSKNSNSLIIAAKIIKIIQDGKFDIDEFKKLNCQFLLKSIENFNEKLENRHLELYSIKNLLVELEKILGQLLNQKEEKSTKISQPLAQPANRQNRMVYCTK